MRTAVVLPAPFGPRRPSTVPGRDREVDAVEGDDVAEALAESFRVDGWSVHAVTTLALILDHVNQLIRS